ncbi:MAG: hypothetical protein MI724_10020 [Spirochaetales bacterium]|nr:hypothetical protein [Spirochaetales bacterium]
MVLSPSGWRGVFGGSDESLERSISTVHRDLVALAAEVFAEAVEERAARGRATIVIATDTRPTGDAIADTAMRVFVTHSLEVRWLGIAAAPEIMAYTGRDGECDAFFFVSASHNPSGHNGLKMGFSDGAVMSGEVAHPMIEAFRARSADRDHVHRLIARVSAVSPAALARIDAERARYKAAALDVYARFTLRVAARDLPSSGAGHDDGSEHFRTRLRAVLERRPVGIVAELNGSARADSIDRSFLPDLGIRVALYNDRPGVFAHQILPEGAGLSDAARLLERHHAMDPAFAMAYVPDNDGDRGNLVFVDRDGRSAPLEAQAVFALAVMVELAWLREREREAGVAPSPKIAVVANGPTSARIDDLCEAFGARLFRAEVGEANVVSLADRLRSDGWMIAIMGEGSNGGNITPPSKVRDPMSTLLAMVKLHAFSLIRVWNELRPGESAVAEETDFLSAARSLPHFTTIETDDRRAKMSIGATSHKALKAAYERALPERIGAVLPALEGEYGTSISWRVENYEGVETRPGVGNRTGRETGGLRVIFADSSDRVVASVWMRGSGTEPVFRVLADCRGETQTLADRLIEWQREMVASAATASEVVADR